MIVFRLVSIPTDKAKVFAKRARQIPPSSPNGSGQAGRQLELGIVVLLSNEQRKTPNEKRETPNEKRILVVALNHPFSQFKKSEDFSLLMMTSCAVSI